MRKRTAPGDGVLLLAGKGHNGDDTRAAAGHLADRRADLINVRTPAEELRAVEAALSRRPALVVDGLFGIGLDRPLSPEWVALVGMLNSSRCPVLAVDVPSGLDADTGEPMGAAVTARTTLTLGAPKRGLLKPGAACFTGRIEVEADIGLVEYAGPHDVCWTLPGEFSACPPVRPESGHKGTFGHLAVVAGSVGYHGAAVLAARGAQRAQPGLVTLLTCADAYVPVASQLQAVMVRPWEDDGSFLNCTVPVNLDHAPHPTLSPAQCTRAAVSGLGRGKKGEGNVAGSRRGDCLPTTITAILAGPGLASPRLPSGLIEWVVRAWRESPLPVIIDASALDWLPEGPTLPGASRIVTPHPGEAARLLRSTTATVQADRAAALRAVSRKLGNCWVVLKGRHTLVGRAEGAVFVNPSGNPRLAQGGSGDLLAGFIGGCLAQPAWHEDVLLALRYAVWQHGAAADVLSGLDVGGGGTSLPTDGDVLSLPVGPMNWTIEDLARVLGAVSV